MNRRTIAVLGFAISILLGACGGGEEELTDTEIEITELLETEEGRIQLALNLSTSTPMTPDQARCFVDNSEVDVLVGIIEIGRAQPGVDAATVVEGLRQGLETCGVRLDSFGIE